MSPDPYDTLERQLRGAVAARRGRASRRLRPRRGLALVLVALVGGGSATAAALLGHGSTSPLDQAVTAGERAASGSPACRYAVPRPAPPVLLTGAPDPRFAAALGILRRPAAAGAPRPDARLLGSVGKQLYGGTLRVARAADGARFDLAVARGPLGGEQLDPVACQQATRAAALASVGAGDAKLRARVAAVVDRGLVAAERSVARRPEVLVYLRRAGTRGAGRRVSVLRYGRGPALEAQGTGAVGAELRAALRGVPTPSGTPIEMAHAARRRILHAGHRIVLTGVVSDDVRRIRVTDRSGPRAQRAAPVLSRVQENVYDIVLPPRMGPRVRIDWLDAAGNVLRRPASPFARAGLVPDPLGAPPWRVSADILGVRTGQPPDPRVCVSFGPGAPTHPRPQSGSACGIPAGDPLDPRGWFFAVRRLDPHRCDPRGQGPFGRGSWCGGPPRTALWGLVGNDVRGVTVLGGPNGPVVATMVHGRILAVLPPVAPARLQVVIERTDGGRVTLPARDTHLIPVPRFPTRPHG